MRRLTSFTAIAALAILLLAIPATASALTFEVDSTGDTPGGACTGAASDCTLRSAIELSNSTPGVTDLIGFTGFDGQLPGSRITLGSALPSITSPAIINGSSCLPAGADVGPCVEVAAPSNAVSVLTVDNSDNSSINGLSLTGGRNGINVINSSAALTITNDWIGVKLDGSGGGNAEAGVFVDPDSDGTAIGGTSLGQRNVISNNAIGVDVLGADNTAIQGNFFGVKPDGATKAENGKDIEITDSTAAPGFDATGTVIGGSLTGPQAESAACDGACNVISGAATHGIDLQGEGALQEEAPASGSTTIQGNLIGPNAAGTGVVKNFRSGILVGEADKVLVGGASPELANRINGGEAGIQAGPSAQDLKVEGNRIGLDAAGTGEELAPETEGIAVKSEGTTAGHAAEIVGNRIAMAGGVAIEVEKSGVTATKIAENVIGRGVGGEHLTAGMFGIRLDNSLGTGSAIEGNVVENAHIIGLLIESSNNSVIGNEILGTQAGSGIVIQKFGPQAASGNTIGGDTAADENLISGSGEDAIEILDSVDTDNHILRNTGSGNGGLFIDLGGDGPGNQPTGPNGGIQAPTISAATPTAVSGGGALAGATIRVFEKATSENGEVKGFLGKAVADSSGNWSLAYQSSLPLGTEIGVTQTGPQGTSELAQATTANPPPLPPSGGGGPGPGPNSPDRTPPQTKITWGPKGKSTSRTAVFKFNSSEAGSSFQCKLDRGPFKKCRSPKKLKSLKPGRHVFKVRAIDGAGNTDPTPAVKKFTVLK
jgi:CSLREA domain-containing protein